MEGQRAMKSRGMAKEEAELLPKAIHGDGAN